jgi:DNA-directed RNA polymerase III subunit RPC5
MTLKAAMDDEGVSADTINDRVKAVQTEAWKRMEFVHPESEGAWKIYEDTLVLQPKAEGAGDIKGKGKADAAAMDEDGEVSAEQLLATVPRLEVEWQEEDLLRAVSGISASERKPGEEMGPVVKTEPDVIESKGKGKEKTETAAPKKRARRPSKAAGAGLKGSRAKGGSSAAAPMELGD